MYKILAFLIFALFFNTVFADPSNGGPTLADIANNIMGQNQKTPKSIILLMMALSGTLGSAFALLAILKFKQHKDNPQQTHLGQPFALFLVAVIFIWLPYYLGETGQTLTGRNDASDRIDLGDSNNLLCPQGEQDSLGCRN